MLTLTDKKINAQFAEIKQKISATKSFMDYQMLTKYKNKQTQMNEVLASISIFGLIWSLLFIF